MCIFNLSGHTYLMYINIMYLIAHKTKVHLSVYRNSHVLKVHLPRVLNAQKLLIVFSYCVMV